MLDASRGAAEAMMRLLVDEVDSAKDRAARRDDLDAPSFPGSAWGTHGRTLLLPKQWHTR